MVLPVPPGPDEGDDGAGVGALDAGGVQHHEVALLGVDRRPGHRLGEHLHEVGQAAALHDAGVDVGQRGARVVVGHPHQGVEVVVVGGACTGARPARSRPPRRPRGCPRRAPPRSLRGRPDGSCAPSGDRVELPHSDPKGAERAISLRFAALRAARRRFSEGTHRLWNSPTTCALPAPTGGASSRSCCSASPWRPGSASSRRRSTRPTPAASSAPAPPPTPVRPRSLTRSRSRGPPPTSTSPRAGPPRRTSSRPSASTPSRPASSAGSPSSSRSTPCRSRSAPGPRRRKEAQQLADAWVAALARQVQAVENPTGKAEQALRIVPIESAALPTRPGLAEHAAQPRARLRARPHARPGLRAAAQPARPARP